MKTNRMTFASNVSLILFMVTLTVSVSAASPEIEVSPASACEVCRCLAGENPKDVVDCQGGGGGVERTNFKISGLPSFVKRIKVSNAGRVTFGRSSVKASDSSVLRVSVNDARDVSFEANSFVLLSRGSGIILDVGNVGGSVGVSSGFLSSPPSTPSGNFTINVTKVNTFVFKQVEGSRWFDILDMASFNGVNDLQLAPYAFKTSSPLRGLELRVSFKDCFVRTLPTDTFPPAASVTFLDSRIQDIESSAFPQTQIGTISFIRTSLDRIHGQAFPEGSLVQKLVFDGCQLTSFSQRAICCGVSRLELRNCEVSSIAETAFDSFAAEVVLNNNTFNTLSYNAIVFKSWSKLSVTNNTFSFVEGDAFGGISNLGTSDEPAVFNFTNNRIASANRDALRVETSLSTQVKVKSNAYLKSCHCQLSQELSLLTGPSSDSVFASLVQNTSLCVVPSTLTKCFQVQPLGQVLVRDYYSLLCGPQSKDQEVTCKTSELDHAWSVFQNKLEADSNRGILLILLLFVLASCLVVGILTLFRWMVWTFRNRKANLDEEEWNFTKVEERLNGVPSPLPRDDVVDVTLGRHHEVTVRGRGSGMVDHYESLPLTTTEVLMESPSSPRHDQQTGEGVSGGLDDSPSSTGGRGVQGCVRNGESSAAGSAFATSGPFDPSNSRSTTVSSSNNGSSGNATSGATAVKSEENELRSSSPEGTVGHKPQPTFYDEMLCLLKEKLDDPENYASVVDNASQGEGGQETQHLLYQDPLDIHKDQH